MKNKNEEIRYLGSMLTATRVEDKSRIKAIANRLLEIGGARDDF